MVLSERFLRFRPSQWAGGAAMHPLARGYRADRWSRDSPRRDRLAGRGGGDGGGNTFCTARVCVRVRKVLTT